MCSRWAGKKISPFLSFCLFYNTVSIWTSDSQVWQEVGSIYCRYQILSWGRFVERFVSLKTKFLRELIDYIYADILGLCHMATHSSLSFLVKLAHIRLTEENLRADIQCIRFEVLATAITKTTACHLLSRWYLAQLMLRPWRWRRYVPPKSQLTFNGPHGLVPRR
jgi:hypothetical protein